MLTQLREYLKGRVVILGMGNTLKGDDGLGPHLAQALKGKVEANVFDGGTAPENYLEPIAKLEPDTVAVIDAVHFNGLPGQIRIFKTDDFNNLSFSTHNLSPQLLMKYLQLRSKAKVILLAVEPQSLTFGGPITEPVASSLEKIKETLVELLGKERRRATLECNSKIESQGQN